MPVKIKSTLGSVTLAAENVSGDTTLTVPSGTGTVATTTQVNRMGGRKNLIINGAMQVSQRGDYTTATAIANGTYYLDRWAGIVSGVTGTIQDTDRKTKLVATSTATGSLRARQTIEHSNWLPISGKTITFSCKVTSNTANARLNIYADGWLASTSAHSGGGSEETLSFTATLPAGLSATGLQAHIGIDGVSSADVSITSGDYVEFGDVQLELGDTATDFEHRSYGEELALCQRYYYRLYNGGSTVGQGYCVRDGDTTRRHLFQWVSPMRATPSLSATWNSGSPGVQYANTISGQIYVTGAATTTEYLFTEVIADAEL